MAVLVAVVELPRAMVPAVAGAARMPMVRFLIWNVLGGTVGASAVLIAGYLAGGSWAAVQGRLGSAATVLGATAIAVALVALAVARRRRKHGGRRSVLTGDRLDPSSQEVG